MCLAFYPIDRRKIRSHVLWLMLKRGIVYAAGQLLQLKADTAKSILRVLERGVDVKRILRETGEATGHVLLRKGGEGAEGAEGKADRVGREERGRCERVRCFEGARDVHPTTPTPTPAMSVADTWHWLVRYRYLLNVEQLNELLRDVGFKGQMDDLTWLMGHFLSKV